MAIATEETLKETAKVMYRGCSVCCAFVAVLMFATLAQLISAPYSPYTPEEALTVVLVMAVGPALVSVILYYLSRQKRVPSDDTTPIMDWSDDEP
ncbi:MAG: hypothetical protein ACXADO_05995 [Candidatus Thorarchaeota archaeon]|jgi:hypothetical protein